MTAKPTGAEDPASGSAETTWTDEVWRSSDGLLARIHHPVPAPASDTETESGAAPRTGLAGAVVLDIHGGAWNAMDRTLGQTYDQAVAAAGLTVVAIDFRDGRQARHPAAVDDIAEAVDWVINHDHLDVDRDRIALVGSSSGGHLALHAALTALPDLAIRLVAALWPPVDPLGRYRYAETMVGQPVPEGNRLNAAGLLASTEAYFGDEATMAEASIAAIVRSGRASQLPPVWVAQAGEDLNVPAELLEDLEAAYGAAGGHLERTTYPGAIHGFGHGDTPAGQQFRRDLVDRLVAALS